MLAPLLDTLFAQRRDEYYAEKFATPITTVRCRPTASPHKTQLGIMNLYAKLGIRFTLDVSSMNCTQRARMR
ncbi:hypothetical protein [Paraburkholderia atlantica]|uniref:hypothetical protein n=1 Tax=Paraburkholderia atlantica TaxID=2654982 RepID=UPI00161033F1|nr:hypothetical protein [Paraburkholderia atlantica]MBB5421756.1 hypothetical protein [Paraburkholderia atlantica]